MFLAKKCTRVPANQNFSWPITNLSKLSILIQILLHAGEGKKTKSARTELSSVQSLDPLGRQGDMRNSAEILFQSLQQEALVSHSGMGKDVHSLMPSIQHFLC